MIRMCPHFVAIEQTPWYVDVQVIVHSCSRPGIKPVTDELAVMKRRHTLIAFRLSPAKKRLAQTVVRSDVGNQLFGFQAPGRISSWNLLWQTCSPGLVGPLTNPQSAEVNAEDSSEQFVHVPGDRAPWALLQACLQLFYFDLETVHQ